MHDRRMTEIERTFRAILAEARTIEEENRYATLFPHIQAENDDCCCGLWQTTGLACVDSIHQAEA